MDGNNLIKRSVGYRLKPTKTMNNEHYHHPEKGCEMETKKIKTNPPQYNCDGWLLHIKGFYCKTHKVNTHAEGWEIGWYGGTNSRALDVKCPTVESIERQKKEQRKARIKEYNRQYCLAHKEKKRKYNKEKYQREKEQIRIKNRIKRYGK